MNTKNYKRLFAEVYEKGEIDKELYDLLLGEIETDGKMTKDDILFFTAHRAPSEHRVDIADMIGHRYERLVLELFELFSVLYPPNAVTDAGQNDQAYL